MPVYYSGMEQQTYAAVKGFVIDTDQSIEATPDRNGQISCRFSPARHCGAAGSRQFRCDDFAVGFNVLVCPDKLIAF
jgi:hypothetical protein